MVYVRAIHFAATLMAVGVVFFAVFVAAPALRAAPGDTRVRAALTSRHVAVMAPKPMAQCKRSRSLTTFKIPNQMMPEDKTSIKPLPRI